MDCVAGGTQWAVAMAAQRRLPVFVFDDEVSEQILLPAAWEAFVQMAAPRTD